VRRERAGQKQRGMGGGNGNEGGKGQVRGEGYIH